jgi:hypothetical protein
VYDGVVQTVDTKRKRLVRLTGASELASSGNHSDPEEEDELELDA